MRLPASVFALIYDPLVAMSERAGLADRRLLLLMEARGRVLEIGAGTGRNVPHYPCDLEGLVLTEPLEQMARRVEKQLVREGRAGTVPPNGRASRAINRPSS